MIKKGDKVRIVDCKRYDGYIFEVTGEPHVVCNTTLVDIYCPEIHKRFLGGYDADCLERV